MYMYICIYVYMYLSFPVRSRETAQATRKRRQLYITRLQKLITELSRNLSCQLSSTEPDNSRRVFSKQRAARCDVVQKFFKYRSEGMANQNTWAKLVEPKFVLTQPPLPFKVYSDFESVGQFYYCRKVEGLATDTAALRSAMVQIAVGRAKCAKYKCTAKVTYAKRAGSDLKKQNRNKKKTISKTIEISNVENIKSEIMSVKRQKKNSI